MHLAVGSSGFQGLAVALGKAADQLPLCNVGFHDSAREELLGRGAAHMPLSWAGQDLGTSQRPSDVPLVLPVLPAGAGNCIWLLGQYLPRHSWRKLDIVCSCERGGGAGEV